MKTIITLIAITILSIPSFSFTNIDGVDPTTTNLKKWVNQYNIYPSISLNQNEEGMVLVSFELSIYGEMENIAIDKSISNELDQKAIEIIKSMPKDHLFANGFIEGTRFVLPVKFTIN